jgi:glycine/D-amino acid oxidase-like deaminating enzyme
LIDCLIVGGGIAGASVAYFLKHSGQKVAVADDTGFVSQASLVAGAFINPVMGKPSKFKTFADEAFRFSVSFYSQNFPKLFNRCGSLIYPKNEKSKDEFFALGDYIPSEYDFMDISPFGAFLVKDSGIINPAALIDAMLEGVDRIDLNIGAIKKEGDVWRAGEIVAKNIVLAQGATAPIINEPYLTSQITKLWGQKCKIKTNIALQYNISSKVYIAQIDGGLAIGATHIRSETPIAINRDDSMGLIKEAKEVVEIGDFEIIEEVGGMRSASIDHFPIVGAVYDSKVTLSRFPSLIHGARLSSEAPAKYENLYVHTGHGSRAFILAPYTAKLLADAILYKSQIQSHIDPARLLFRYFKKNTPNQALDITKEP